MKKVGKNVKAIHKQWKKCQELSSGEYAKALDEEVAAMVCKLIWKTAHLLPREQAERFVKAGHCFHWRMLSSNWLAADISNRVFHDEEALKELLCEGLQIYKNDDANNLAQSIHHAKFIHFQTTKAFNGGFDVYIVFRIAETARTIVIRLCK